MKKIILGVVLLFSGGVNAGLITDTSVFDSSDNLVTFDEIILTNGASVTNQFLAYGVAFTPELQYETSRGDFSGFTGNNLANFYNGPIINPFEIIFNNTVDGFGAYWEFNNTQQVTFQALLGGIVVDTFNYTETNCCTSGSFLGFSGVSFDSVLVSLNTNTSNSAMIMDNLYFSNATEVPEPGPLLLLGLGLAGLGYSRKKKAV